VTDRLRRFADWSGRLIPDALTTSIAMLALVFAAALALGNSLAACVDAYYGGLWKLLDFTMQMSLILVLSATLGTTNAFKALVVRVARWPRTRPGVIALAVLVSAALSYLYWGLGIALSPLVAVHCAREAEKRGLRIDFPFLLSVVWASNAVWQFGLSASAPLLMNTPGHFLEKTTGLMPLSTTIFAPASLGFVAAFLVAVFLAALLLHPRTPRPLSEFPPARDLGAEAPPPDDPPTSPSERLESHPLPTLLLCVALAGWLWHHFFTKRGGLDLNSLNTILLLASLVIHRNARSFTRALQGAVLAAWPVIVLYHLYAGMAGLIQYTSVGDTLATFFADISTPLTFPLFTAVASAVVSLFVPSSGGQWVIQGFVTAKAAAAVGVTTQRALLALSVGDHVGNLVSPFWVVIVAGVARVDFRTFIGYNTVFAVLWFVLGVLAFTFLPA
jgi:short-chain fatty acids transporter